MKPADQSYAGKDENCPHDERAQNPPEQNFVLLLVGYSEITEDHEEDEQVVHAERELDYVTCHELERGRPSVPEIDEHSKGASQGDPHHTPTERLAKTDGVLSTMKDPQIENQHRQHEDVEKNPENSLVQQVPQRFKSSIPANLQSSISVGNSNALRIAKLEIGNRQSYCFRPRFPLCHSFQIPKIFNCSSRWFSRKACSICARLSRGPSRSEALAMANTTVAASATCFLS